LKAATIRNHRPLLNLAENAKEGEIRPVSYHRKCRNSQAAAAAADEISDSNVESGEQRPRRQEPSTSRTYPEIYIFFVKGKLEVLVQSLKVKNTLKLKSIVLVFYQALYVKAAEVQWKQSEKFKYIVLRMGVFHIAAEAWYHGHCY